MANVLSEERKQQFWRWGGLGCAAASTIEEETGSAGNGEPLSEGGGISIRSPGGWGRRPPPKAAKEALTDFRRVRPGQNRHEVHTDSGPGIAAKPANEVSTDSASGSAAASWPPRRHAARG